MILTDFLPKIAIFIVFLYNYSQVRIDKEAIKHATVEVNPRQVDPNAPNHQIHEVKPRMHSDYHVSVSSDPVAATMAVRTAVKRLVETRGGGGITPGDVFVDRLESLPDGKHRVWMTMRKQPYDEIV